MDREQSSSSSSSVSRVAATRSKSSSQKDAEGTTGAQIHGQHQRWLYRNTRTAMLQSFVSGTFPPLDRGDSHSSVFVSRSPMEFRAAICASTAPCTLPSFGIPEVKGGAEGERGVSLTPSRNNGFLNMLNMMKNQALALK
ncbi:hypothetical protein T484DRAFT_1840377 [Baffinella frigidus]|nr:hypothetical protein T484DRAFT_1840377 [Cryptophyta sp. CCMP2293]